MDRVHYQRVGDDDTVVAKLATQQIAEHRSRQRRRVFAVDASINDVGRHDGGGFMDQRAKRQELHRVEPIPHLVHDGQIQMRVDGRVAVPGEVLDATGDALA